jgi:sterol desaturase/sphingolipid hydroxylase (fatty acid hydroxylase superfamily)
VHHADVDLDVSSALRFHPLEILLSVGYKLAIVLLLGIGPEALVVFEVILSSMAMFNHSNLHIPFKLEKVLRLFIVTPQLHIIHHSVYRKESDMNYGFNLSLWDRLFRTYQKEFSTSGQIGQSYYREKIEHNFKKILLLPFVSVTKEIKNEKRVTTIF